MIKIANNFNKLLIGALLAVPVLSGMSGCKKFLDRQPLSATQDDLSLGALEGCPQFKSGSILWRWVSKYSLGSHEWFPFR
jgi:hypothetical protein